MALKRNERYPGRFDNPTSDHPQGAFKNRSAPNAEDGTYLEKDWANDWDGFFARLLTVASITANGNVDSASTSQYFDAMIQSVKNNLGTAAQRNVGTGTNQIPDISAFTGTKARNGQMILPSGLIFKWGEVATAGAQINVTFPTAYAGNVIFGSVTHLVENLNNYFFAQVTDRTTTGLTIAIYSALNGQAPTSNASSVTLGWFALGY